MSLIASPVADHGKRRNRRTRVLLALATLVTFSAGATPPEPPVTIALGAELKVGKLAEGRGSVAVFVDLRGAAEDASGAEFSVELVRADDPLKSIRRDLQRRKLQREDVAKGRIALDVPVQGRGHYEVDARLSGGSEGAGFSDRSILHVLVDSDGSFQVMTGREFARAAREAREKRFHQQLELDPRHPDVRLLLDSSVSVPAEIQREIRDHGIKPDQQLEVRPIGPSETQRRYTIDNSATAWASKDPLTVRGRLTYRDFDNVWRPLVNVSVNLWDEDWDWDEHLGSVATDWNGNWSFSVNNNDGWGANGRDIYYTFKLANTRIRVQDCDGIDSTYEWQSGVREDVNDGTVIDYGSETGSTHRKSMQIWNHLNLTWNHATTSGGQDPGFVDSCFPYDETRWDRFWEELDIEEQYNDGPDVVTHEYGHAVMWYAYDEENPSEGGAHGFDDCNLSAGKAWSEGWASGYMLSQRPDGRFNWHEGDGGYALEQHSSVCRTGERNEGWVAAALNDLRDAPNDSNGGNQNRGRDGVDDSNASNRVPLATMLRDTLWGSYHDGFLDYWYSLSGELTSAQAAPAQRAMFYDWMSVVEPGSCVASKITTRGLDDRDNVLANLRTFRDKALKPFPGGRRLANLYYRHSPELALILLKDEALRADALAVVRYFAQVGAVLDSNARSRKSLGGNAALIDAQMAARIDKLIAAFTTSASDDLKHDLVQVKQALETVRGQSFETLALRVAEAKSRRDDANSVRLRQSDLAPGSAKAARSDELKKALE